MRGKKGTKGEGRYAANLLLSFRVTAEEKARLEQQADMAGLIVGARAPIALTSRGATEKEKRQSLLLAAACAKGER